MIPEFVENTQNLEYSSRATNDPDVTQGTRIGTFHDVNAVTNTEYGQEPYQELHTEINLEKYTLDGCIDRMYPTSTLTWSSADAEGALLLTQQFPSKLLTNNFLFEKINNFKFFKSGTRISFRVVANKFLYGRILVQFVPYPNWNGTGMGAPYRSAAGYPSLLLSASTAETASMDLPFVFPDRALDTTNMVDVWAIRVFVLNKLHNVSDATTCTATVYVSAQFLNPELYYPLGDALPTGFITHSKQEGTIKSEKGVISDSLESLAAIAGSVSNAPFVSNYASGVHTFSRQAAKLARMVGLNKPMSLASTTVARINPFQNMNYGRGIDTGVKLAIDPENAISTSLTTGGNAVDEMNLNYIAGTPCLVDVYPIVAGSVPIAIYGPHHTEPTILRFLKGNFQYWSGSTKLKVYITASQFHTVRMVFWLQDNLTAREWADCYHQIVEIQGDTEVSFTIPYVSTQYAVNSTDEDWEIHAAVLSFSQPDPSLNTPIYLNVYEAAGPDFQFYLEKDNQWAPTSQPREDFSQIFAPLHPTMKEFHTEGVHMGEKITSLREIVHRDHPYFPVTSTTSLDPWIRTTTSGRYLSIEKYGCLFAFYRGSLRMKLVNKPNQRGAAYVSGQTSCVSAALSYQNNPMVDLTIPFYTTYAFLPCRTTDATLQVPRVFLDPLVDWFLMKSTGDDFSFVFVQPPPVGDFATNGSAFGNPALTTFYTQTA